MEAQFLYIVAKVFKCRSKFKFNAKLSMSGTKTISIWWTGGDGERGPIRDKFVDFRRKTTCVFFNHVNVLNGRIWNQENEEELS